MQSIKINNHSTAFEYSAVHGDLTCENKDKKNEKKNYQSNARKLSPKALLEIKRCSVCVRKALGGISLSDDR